jgi:DNA polymerase-1
MRYLSFSEQPTYPIAILVSVIRKDEILREYVNQFDIPQDDVMVLDLHYAQGKKKTPAVEMKQYITEELIPALTTMEAKYIVVTDSEYFKILTKAQRTEINLGYVLDCAYGDFKVVYVPNYRTIFYDPEKIRAKIKQGINALLHHIGGSYKAPGNGIIKFAAYPKTDEEIQAWLDKLLDMNTDLSIDIEGFSLKHYKAGIGTITFCWSKHEGIAFPVDYVPIPGATSAPYGQQVRNEPRRKMLRAFFKKFLKRALYHSIHYDVCVLIQQLFMSNLLDTEGTLNGLDILLRNWEDTKLITYLATNSCSGNKLSLKDQAQEFAGNYGLTEIEDISRIPLDELLHYNLIDGLSTWYTYEKHYPVMVADQQLDLYQGLFKDAIVDIIQMQLTGLPVNMKRTIEVKSLLEADETKALKTILTSKVVKDFTKVMNKDWVVKRNAKLKVKRVSLSDANETFNPNSGPQLQKLLYEMLVLPVISYTDSKQPSVDKDTLTALVHHAKDLDAKNFLLAMIDYSSVNKILTSFIPALMDAALGPDGWHYVFGSFNLGGTVSGRLSSSDPNLQNLPATGTKYAKLIKSCFEAPPGWLLCGLDFASLEDKISALTTKDPNKIKVYTDGYDGHSLRAQAYFGDQMPKIRLSNGRRAFKVTSSTGTLYLLEGDVVVLPNGRQMPIELAITN